jgi:hypothetical protein
MNCHQYRRSGDGNRRSDSDRSYVSTEFDPFSVNILPRYSMKYRATQWTNYLTSTLAFITLINQLPISQSKKNDEKSAKNLALDIWDSSELSLTIGSVAIESWPPTSWYISTLTRRIVSYWQHCAWYRVPRSIIRKIFKNISDSHVSCLLSMHEMRSKDSKSHSSRRWIQYF